MVDLNAGDPSAREEFEAAVRREFETLRPEIATRGKEDRIQNILAAHDKAASRAVARGIHIWLRAYADALPGEQP
jgi:hypothetical protein